MLTAVRPARSHRDRPRSERPRSSSIRRVAEHLDLSRHVGEHTAMLADALLEHLLDELGREGIEAGRSQDIAMGAVASIMAQCGGDHCYITSLSSAASEIDKERAREMLAGGYSVRQIVQMTSLSTYQVKRVREEVGAGEKAPAKQQKLAA